MYIYIYICQGSAWRAGPLEPGEGAARAGLRDGHRRLEQTVIMAIISIVIILVMIVVVVVVVVVVTVTIVEARLPLSELRTEGGGDAGARISSVCGTAPADATPEGTFKLLRLTLDVTYNSIWLIVQTVLL